MVMKKMISRKAFGEAHFRGLNSRSPQKLKDVARLMVVFKDKGKHHFTTL
jgi:hypothetical protein